jgi:hypothetical protein
MNDPQMRQLEDSNTVEIRIPFRMPLNIAGGRKEIEVDVGGEGMAWKGRVAVARGAMQAVLHVNCDAVTVPCRLWCKARSGGCETGLAYLYFGPVPLASVIRNVRFGGDGVLRWDIRECPGAPPITGYMVFDPKTKQLVGTAAAVQALEWRHVGLPIIRAVNLNGYLKPANGG